VREPLGDKLFDIAIGMLAFTFIIGWILLLSIMFLQWALPNRSDSLELFLQKASKPLTIVQKYAGYSALILLALRFIAGLLGWGPPLPVGEEE
jgi:hypothetical protein